MLMIIMELTKLFVEGIAIVVCALLQMAIQIIFNVIEQRDQRQNASANR